MQMHMVIHGQVQGVFFRSHAKEVADRLGLVGWVKNREDGSVELEASGNKDKLEQLVAWCRKGSSSAIVGEVEVKWEASSRDFKSFEIIYE